MTRVIHTADTHIGYRQYHSPERREDFLAAFEQVVEDAVDMGVDAVVHAGDVFHDRRPDLPDLLGTIGALRELSAAEVPFLAVVGNHEDKRDAQWLDLFEELGLATRLDREGVVVGDVTFYGLDFVPRARRDDLEYEFAPPDTEHAALVAHGLFEPFAHADWDTEAVLDAATVDFDAMLLGDNHHPDTAQVGGTWVTYAGSTERVSAEEEADRGYNVVTFEDGVDVARRGLPTRAFAYVDVQLREGEGVERVRERLREHDLEGAVAIVRVDGEGEPVTPAAVEEFARERGALVARVTDRRDLDDEAGEPEVSFADPDEAVRRRVRELGLSEAAREIDATVRSGDLADANVRETVAERVREFVEEDEDLAAFEPADDDATTDEGTAPATDGEPDAAVVDDATTDEDPDAAAAGDEDAAAAGEEVPTDATGDGPAEGTAVDDDRTDDGGERAPEAADDDAAAGGDGSGAAVADESGEAAAGTGDDGVAADEPDIGADADADAGGGGEQASMEEYL